MGRDGYLGEFEQAVLWSVLRHRGEGYGALVLADLQDRVERRVTPGALYATLDRLEQKGMIVASEGDPEPGRGGRPKRYLAVTPGGRAALAKAREEWRRLWDGLDPVEERG